MSYRISIENARKRIPSRAVGRVTATDGRPATRMSFGKFLSKCPYMSVMTGMNDGPEHDTWATIEYFYNYTVNGIEFEYHVCRKYYYDESKKQEWVYPTKLTSDYVGGVKYTSKGRIYL